MLKRALCIFSALVLGVGVLVGSLHVYYRSQIFQPLALTPDPAEAPFAVEAVRVPTVDGFGLNAWYRAPDAGRLTVLYLHGNSNNIGHYTRGTGPLVEAGYGILMLDYRGYGGNPGYPSDEHLLIDGHAALDWLERRGTPSERVALYGYSLGSGVAVPLAAQARVAGVILAAPFASIAHLGYTDYPRWFVDLLLFDRFDSLAAIGQVEEPVLIFHGTADETVPPAHSALLAAAGGGNVRRVLVEDATHGWDLFEPEGNRLVLEFLDRIYASAERDARAAASCTSYSAIHWYAVPDLKGTARLLDTSLDYRRGPSGREASSWAPEGPRYSTVDFCPASAEGRLVRLAAVPPQAFEASGIHPGVLTIHSADLAAARSAAEDLAAGPVRPGSRDGRRTLWFEDAYRNTFIVEEAQE